MNPLSPILRVHTGTAANRDSETSQPAERPPGATLPAAAPCTLGGMAAAVFDSFLDSHHVLIGLAIPESYRKLILRTREGKRLVHTSDFNRDLSCTGHWIKSQVTAITQLDRDKDGEGLLYIGEDCGVYIPIG